MAASGVFNWLVPAHFAEAGGFRFWRGCEAGEAGSWPDECRGGVVLQWYLAYQIDDNGMMR